MNKAMGDLNFTKNADKFLSNVKIKLCEATLSNLLLSGNENWSGNHKAIRRFLQAQIMRVKEERSKNEYVGNIF